MAQTQNKDQGAFIPSTQVWDVSEIYQDNVGSEELKELLVRMYQNLNRMAISVNVKDSGYYDTQEFVTGQQFFKQPKVGILVDTTNGAGAAAGNVPGAVYELGQQFSIGNERLTVVAVGTPGVLDTPGPSTLHTYDTTTGAYNFTTAAINTEVYFYLNLDSTNVRKYEYRPVFRKVINFGGLPNTGTKSLAHYIACDANTIFTRIYGVATDPTGGFSYLPLPYASPTDANNIELSVTGTNVSITTGSNRAAYTVCYCVLEYIKF